jgi:RNA polymerase sigma-70 factor (ECF subfamily)
MFFSVVIPGILLEGPVRETGVGTLSGRQERRPGDGMDTRRRESVHASMTVEKSTDATSSEDADALSLLYEQFRRPIHSYIYRLLGSLEDADDLTQEVFVRACIAWDGLYERNNLSAWLYRIATNLCVDLLRRRKRISWWPLSYHNSNDDRFESGASDDNSPLLPDSGGIPEIAEREHIRLALSNMPEEYAVALVLSAAQGIPYREIAAIVGISPNAAATRISRAKRMFAEQYQRLNKEGVEKQENLR